MRLARFGAAGHERPGVLLDDDTVGALDPLLAARGIHGGMTAALGLLASVREWVQAGEVTERHRLADVRLGPPVIPANLIAAGANTWTHLREASRHTNGAPARTPMLIPKAVTALTGPYDAIVRPPETAKLDYETELGVVIGRRAWRVAPEDVADHVAGYVVTSDLTARDVQTGEGEDVDFYWQHFRGKSYPTFCPIGPWIVTADEVADPAALPLRTYVDEELRQDSTVADLIADIPTLISSISTCVPLSCGDVILTGSPAGVGHFADPPRYLEPGSVLRSVVGGIGELVNPVVDWASADAP